MTRIRAIMDTSLTELEEATNYPLAPDPHTPEANIMLPENRPQDYRIFHTLNLSQSRFCSEESCEECGSKDFVIDCLICGAPNCCSQCCLAQFDISNFKAITETTTTEDEEEKSCLKCRHLVRLKDSLYGEHDCHTWANLPDEIFTYIFWHLECPQHCGSFEAIASGGAA